jgi:hypothetical protein
MCGNYTGSLFFSFPIKLCSGFPVNLTKLCLFDTVLLVWQPPFTINVASLALLHDTIDHWHLIKQIDRIQCVDMRPPIRQRSLAARLYGLSPQISVSRRMDE